RCPTYLWVWLHDVCYQRVKLNGPNAVRSHRQTCQFSRANLGSPNDILSQMSNMGINGDGRTRGPQAFALSSKMVGGGSDGSLNLFARVDVQKIIQDFLCNGELIWKIRSSKGTGKARILVGHGLGHDLGCLGMEYPSNLIRDTAKYPPLMKTSKLRNTLKYLTQAYLGYDIQTRIQDPFEDCVAAMRLNKRMCNQNHKAEEVSTATDAQNRKWEVQ
ncbi:hypothetical protein MKX01_025245, partial [Papaver californicum]